MALRSGIATSVAIFLLVTTVCCILSLSSSDDNRPPSPRDTTHSNVLKFRVSTYVPNLVMTFVMLIGIVAMIILIFKPGDLTTNDDEDQLTRRHYLHRKHSFRSIMFFCIVGSILHLNYVIVEFVSMDSWTHCDDHSVTVTNSSELIFHFVCIIFAICETIVCWIIKHRNFKPSQWVWHGVAVVQAANLAIWFESLLNESYHRINDNAESFDSYFSFCNTTSQNGNHSVTSSSDFPITSKWFTSSIPFLFPVTIEFAVLVSESLLGKVIGESHNSDHCDHANVPADGPAADDNETTPLLPRGNENPNRTYARCSKIFILISSIFSIGYFVLTMLIFVGYKLKHDNDDNDDDDDGPGITSKLQMFENAFMFYSAFYLVFSFLCCAVGILSCRKFRRPHSHTSFLEYLLLLATSGVLLRSMKRIVAFISSTDEPIMLALYVVCGSLHICQSLLQIVFYYFAKDVKLQPFSNGGRADRALSVAVFKAILTVTSVINLFIWLSDTLVLPDILPSITPSHYQIEQWSVFDNAVTPITIFFRWNSALLFWCIGTDEFKPDERQQRHGHHDGPYRRSAVHFPAGRGQFRLARRPAVRNSAGGGAVTFRRRQ